MSWLNLSSVSSVICTFQVFSITKRLSFAVDVRPFCGPHFLLGPTDDNPGGTFRQKRTLIHILSAKVSQRVIQQLGFCPSESRSFVPHSFKTFTMSIDGRVFSKRQFYSCRR